VWPLSKSRGGFALDSRERKLISGIIDFQIPRERGQAKPNFACKPQRNPNSQQHNKHHQDRRLEPVQMQGLDQHTDKSKHDTDTINRRSSTPQIVPTLGATWMRTRRGGTMEEDGELCASLCCHWRDALVQIRSSKILTQVFHTHTFDTCGC
jgi:hypothetical protein